MLFIVVGVCAHAPPAPAPHHSCPQVCELALHVLTDRPIDLESSAGVLDAIGWQNRPGSPAHSLGGLRKICCVPPVAGNFAGSVTPYPA